MYSSNIADKVMQFYNNTINYPGSSETFRSNIKKTLFGGTAILCLNALNAPDAISIVAYAYTGYHGFKTFKDFKYI
ncbi:MAG: hypothetical protein ACMXYG_04515 [Candidatus Woesearchaeota archaeon]